MQNAIKHRLAFTFLYPEQLIELVDLFTDIFGLITTSWQFFAVYKTVRNVAFWCAALSMLWT